MDVIEVLALQLNPGMVFSLGSQRARVELVCMFIGQRTVDQATKFDQWFWCQFGSKPAPPADGGEAHGWSLRHIHVHT